MGWLGWVALAEDMDDEEETTGHYTQYDAKNDTNTTRSQASQAWHTARDDAEEDGEITRTRNRKK
jgi:uncharacterized protein YgiB involved in biofilm formation